MVLLGYSFISHSILFVQKNIDPQSTLRHFALHREKQHLKIIFTKRIRDAAL